MINPEIRIDQFFEIKLMYKGEEHNFAISPKWDRIDVYRPLGVWILKMYDDEAGLIQGTIDEDTANKIIKDTGLPLVERDFIYQSEHELWIKGMANLLDDLYKFD